MRLRFIAVMAAVFIVMYVGYQQIAAQNIVTCPGLVQRAIDSVGDNCGGMDRNSACYGFSDVEAAFSVVQPVSFFTAPSDRARLLELESLSTSPMVESLGKWGIALLSVQANLPDTLPGQSVVFMLMGDTQVENAVTPEDTFQTGATVNVTLSIGADLYYEAALGAQVVGSIPQGTALTADAVSDDGQWVRVVYRGTPGWITRQVLTADGDLSTLPVIGPDTRTPMQAFYFRTSISGTQCTEAPNALVVQGPESLMVDININGADVRLGSTVVFYLLPVDPATLQYLVDLYGEIGAITRLMQVLVIDGHVILNAGTPEEMELNTGETTFICLNDPENLGADGQDNDRSVFAECPWAPPRPVTVEDLERFRELEGFTLNYPIDLPLLLPTVTPSPTNTPRPFSGGGVIVPTATFTPTFTPTNTLPPPPPPGQPTWTPSPIPPPSDTPLPTATFTDTLTPTATATDQVCNDGYTFPINVPSENNAMLIAVINAANDEVCHPGADAIQLTGVEGSNFTFTSADNNTNGPNALPVISSTITITGPGNLNNPDYFFRYFYISPTGNLTLQNISFDFGSLSGYDGGAIYNDGVLNYYTGTVSGSYADNGGGIYNAGTMTLTDVYLDNNSATGNGGNLYSSGVATITRSWFAYGNAASGGNVYIGGGSASLLNSTISSSYSGGGINVAGGAARLNFVTVASNTGTGISGSGITMKNSIAALQSPNCSATITSVAGNFTDDTSCPFTQSANLSMGVFDYPGVHPLGQSSDAVDATDCTTDLNENVANDLRQEPRPYDANQAGPPDCDAGSFEFGQFDGQP